MSGFLCIFDSNGIVVVKYEYDAWGSCKVFDPETINGLNLYAYCGNNPIMAVDPEGTWSWKKFWKGVAAVAIIVVVAAAIAVTAGAAAVAIAGALGATAIMAGAIGAAVATTAFICGGIVGSIETASQVMNKGLENINLLSIGIATMGASLDGAMIAGAAFAGPVGKALLAGGRIGVSGLAAAFYGLSEQHDYGAIINESFKAMLNTAIASALPFFFKGVDPKVLLPQGAVAQFSGVVKFGLSLFNMLNISLFDLLTPRKNYKPGVRRLV